MSSVKEKTLSGIKWNSVGLLSTKGINFLLGLLIARLLVPEDYGLIGMLAFFMAIAQSFVDSGFGNALVWKIDRTEVDCATAFYFNIAIGLFFYGILFVIAPYISAFYDLPILTEVVRVFSVIIVFNSLGIVPRALRTIAVDFKSLSFASVLPAVVSGLVGLGMAYSGFGVWALVGQALVSSFLSVAVIWFLARWMPSWTYSWQSFKSMFSYGSKLLASGLLHTLYTNASNLVIGKFYTPADLGHYDRGCQIAAFPSLRFSDMLNSVTFPILAKLQDDNNRLVNVYHQYLAMSSMVIFFIMTLLAVIAKPLILILLTEKWVGAVPFLQVFCLAYMFDSVCRLNNNMLFVKGWSGLFFKLEILKKVLITPVLLLAIHFGVMAICCVAVVHTFVDIACSSYYLRKRLGVSGRHYICLVKYFLLSVLACVPTGFVCSLQVSSWISLPIGCVLAAALYWWLLRKDENMMESLQILKNCIPF